MVVLQTTALPLGYGSEAHAVYQTYGTGSNDHGPNARGRRAAIAASTVAVDESCSAGATDLQTGVCTRFEHRRLVRGRKPCQNGAWAWLRNTSTTSAR